MAVVNYAGVADMRELMSYSAGDSIFFVSSTEIRIGSPTSYDRFVGTGLVVTNGVVTAGTITAFDGSLRSGVTFGEPQISGLNAAASSVYQFLAARSGEALKSLLFGGIDNLVGRDGNDVLHGYGGNDLFNAGRGADTMVGGAGSDTYVVLDAGDRVIETIADRATGGTDVVYSFLASYTLPANVEDGAAGLPGSGITGNALNNGFIANAGNNRFDGGAGVDTLRFSPGSEAVTIRLDTAQPQATGGSGADTYLSIENVVGTENGDRLTGSGIANRLEGQDGNDTLDGLGGADRMIGGDENDTYHVRDSGDLVVEAVGTGGSGGIDTVFSYVLFYTLPANVETGRIATAGDINLTGNALSNRLFSGSGSNRINGGAGTDVVDYSLATAGVRVNLSSSSAQNTWGSGADTLVSIESVRGSAFFDNLVGNSRANNIQGMGGDDLIRGRQGNDVLSGGAGLDHFRFDTVPDRVSNVDTIMDWSSPQDTIELDNAVFTAFASDGSLPGGALRVWTLTDQSVDSSDRIIHDSFHGTLLYDADGSGSQFQPVMFARLVLGAPAVVTAADFVIV